MIKTKKSTKKHFHFHSKINDAAEKTITASVKSESDQEYENYFDSSLELCIPFNFKQKSKVKSHNRFDTIDLTTKLQDTKLKNFKSKENKTINSTNNLSVINISSSSDESFDLTKLHDTKFKNFKSEKNKTINSSNNFSVINISSSSDENFNSTTNILFNEYNNINSASNCVTPKENHIQNNNISKSAKLLDRIYGKKWRLIDGVIKDSKKSLNYEVFKNYEFCDENIPNSRHNDSKNSLSNEISSTANKYIQNQDIQIEVNNTSIILEKCSLSNDDNLANKQLHFENPIAVLDDKVNFKSSSLTINEHNNMELNNIKKKRTSKENRIIKTNGTCLNQLFKTPITSSLEPKLSFLSSLSCFTGSMDCDPEADKYKKRFKKNKDELVAILFKLFNEKVFDNKLPVSMNFKWNARLRSTAGACFNKRTVKIKENLDCERISRIELSTKIIDTAERLRDTLIHELCHAACWIFNGISEGHGPSWKSWANKAMQTFPELPVIKRCHSYDIQTKFTYKCIKCGYSFGRHSKSLNLEKKRCGFCHGEFELIVNKINNNPPTTSNNLPIVYTDPLKELYNLKDIQKEPIAPKRPSKFALFVKDNYGRVKQKNPLLKHGEIMKLLGSQFATTKILTPDEVFDNLLTS